MTKAQKAIEFNQNFHNQLQQIREKYQLSDDLFDLLSEEEISALKENRYEKAKEELEGTVKLWFLETNINKQKKLENKPKNW